MRNLGTTRNFIQESIDSLENASKNIEKFWKQFQAGEIDKERFEEEYKHIIYDNVIDTLEAEVYHPNNACKYNETCPTDYFKLKTDSDDKYNISNKGVAIN